MENETLREILLVITTLAIFVFGFFVMKRLDKFLNENYKPRFIKSKKNSTRIVRNKNALDKAFFDAKNSKEKGGKTTISNEDICRDEQNN